MNGRDNIIHVEGKEIAVDKFGKLCTLGVIKAKMDGCNEAINEILGDNDTFL